MPLRSLLFKKKRFIGITRCIYPLLAIDTNVHRRWLVEPEAAGFKILLWAG
jgi:hypothetical protein